MNKRMNKKGVSMILVEVISAIAIFVFIAIFFFAMKIKGDGIKADIAAQVQSKALDDTLLTYLRSPAGIDRGSYADEIIKLIEEKRIKELDLAYFDELAGRTGICFEYISIYKGSEKQVTLQPTFCKQDSSDAHTPSYRPSYNFDEAWVLLPGSDGSLYMVLATGFKVGS
jgi:hypothetical protein